MCVRVSKGLTGAVGSNREPLMESANVMLHNPKAAYKQVISFLYGLRMVLEWVRECA